MVVIPTGIRRPADEMSRRFGIILSGLAANSNRMIPTAVGSASLRNDNELDCPPDGYLCNLLLYLI
jgi:hypothetical protein